MTEPLFQNDSLDEAVAALRRDLLDEAGPQISTMRNYRFAILPYRPKDEFKLRERIRRLSDDLRAEGWDVLPISLQKLLLDRIRRAQPNVGMPIDDRSAIGWSSLRDPGVERERCSERFDAQVTPRNCFCAPPPSTRGAISKCKHVVANV